MPFFAMLKTFDSKSMGVLCVISSFILLMTLPFVYLTEHMFIHTE
ncbi:MAG: hypothetical protein ACTS80_01955 [Candidatus Hodgkinia cicadicola]